MCIRDSRHVGVEGRDLRKIADAGFSGLRFLQNVVAVDQHLARGGAQITGHNVHGGGFSGSVGAEKAVNPVSYTHLDVYKRQEVAWGEGERCLAQEWTGLAAARRAKRLSGRCGDHINLRR